MIDRPICLLICSMAVLSGCSKEPERPPTYPVTGTVTMKDRPLDGATVVFVPTQGGSPASGVTDKEGRYSLTTRNAGDGAEAGTYGVKVAKYDGQPPPEPAEQGKEISYEEEQKMQFSSDMRPTPPAKSSLPKKYGSEGTSGLTHTVKDGPSTFDIKIE